MRMHRGSSKGDGNRPPPETLPLSASATPVHVTVSLVRAGRSTDGSVEVPRGTPIRAILRLAGHAPEGCAVFLQGVPVPLDQLVEEDLALTVISAFSGG